MTGLADVADLQAVTAAIIALGLEVVGAKNVSLYDGSWAEYAQHPDALIART